jgi:hypothetical protein
MTKPVTMIQRSGRPQGRRVNSTAGLAPISYVTLSFSLPAMLAEMLKTAASKRSDFNRSAVVSEALAEFFGVAVETPPPGGGIEKAESRV